MVEDEEVSEVEGGGQMVEGFVCEDQEFVVVTVRDRKPVELFEERGDVMP